VVGWSVVRGRPQFFFLGGGALLRRLLGPQAQVSQARAPIAS
jgi:hypothetical protein